MESPDDDEATKSLCEVAKQGPSQRGLQWSDIFACASKFTDDLESYSRKDGNNGRERRVDHDACYGSRDDPAAVEYPKLGAIEDALF
mmetsp:Transcript_21354/g.40750  ORF Transcript_21354/g.40750 Transcript_21354/m.40750 type:complete len:87 (+) Transcript_21354:1451-1711(+)